MVIHGDLLELLSALLSHDT